MKPFRIVLCLITGTLVVFSLCGCGPSFDCKLTISVRGSGTTNPATGTHYYQVDHGNHGSSNAYALVTVKAYPQQDSLFDHWEFGKGEQATDNPHDFQVDETSGLNVTAVFKLAPTTLTVNTLGQGTVSLSPAGGSYENGTEVTLTPNAAAGWQFDHWEGDATGNTVHAVVTMSADRTVTAVFIQVVTYTLDVTITGEGNVGIDPLNAAYPAGTSVELEAIPASNWRFDHWSGDLNGSANPATVTMNSNKSITAVFLETAGEGEGEGEGEGGCEGENVPGPGDPSTFMLPGGVQLEMKWCPAGEFEMGSPDSGDPDLWPNEQPQHHVTLTKGFWLGKYEVTQAQWEAVMGNNPSYFKGDPNLPVETVSIVGLFLPDGFLDKLNQAVPCRGFRLPTEAEWEYACRAGTTTRFPWGNDLEHTEVATYAWFGLGADGTTQPVGQKEPNPWGFYDMSGNVYEMVRDLYFWTYGSNKPVTDPLQLGGSNPVTRGGCYWFSYTYCRSAARSSLSDEDGDRTTGFRLAR